ncbi:MAG: hypothetical protein LQ340_002149 [Diploschistes diacapsis]|nr:MAG: hypothetical protein LQ340_002149 [Diploschistes diacapsis]
MNIQIAIFKDAGTTWTQNTAASISPAGRQAVLCASATSIVWSTGSNGAQVLKNGATFATVKGLDQGALASSHKRNDTVFYGSSSGSIVISTDGGSSFGTSVSSAVSAQFINYGKSFVSIAGPTTAYAFALGKNTKNSFRYNIFGFFTIDGVTALYETQNLGSPWTSISDSTHGFGSASSETEGFVFVGTNGHGVFFGTP